MTKQGVEWACQCAGLFFHHIGGSEEPNDGPGRDGQMTWKEANDFAAAA